MNLPYEMIYLFILFAALTIILAWFYIQYRELKGKVESLEDAMCDVIETFNIMLEK